MGSYAAVPGKDSAGDGESTETDLGDLLAGRLADLDLDSVGSVRELREQE